MGRFQNRGNHRLTGSIDKLVLREGFEAQTEILCTAEDTRNVLAKDALAGRVLKAGCTGLAFSHLDTPDFDIDIPATIRTKRGVSLRKERHTPPATDPTQRSLRPATDLDPAHPLIALSA